MASAQEEVRFPGENPAYREAREKLLQAERELRARIEEVAALRRALPLGGKVGEDYVFEEGGADLDDRETKRQVRLSELFRPGKDSLVLYSYMFGPAMKQPCSSCTSILDGLNGQAPHAMQRINLAVVAKSPIERIREFARGRGWRNLRLLSSAGNSYNEDYRAEDATGDQQPAVNVFVRRPEGIFHFYNTEILYAPSEPGQDARHADMIWPLWNLFDLTPEGRGADWHPKLAYATE